MSSTPEYETMENCTPSLEIVFKGADREIVHYLKKEGFINESVRADVLNPRSMLTEKDKAGKLVEAIKDAISPGPEQISCSCRSSTKEWQILQCHCGKLDYGIRSTQC